MSSHRSAGNGIALPAVTTAPPDTAAEQAASAPSQTRDGDEDSIDDALYLPNDDAAMTTNSDGARVLITPKALAPGAFKAFYNNQSLLPASKKTAYIIMMQVDKNNQQLQREYHAALQGDNPSTVTLSSILAMYSSISLRSLRMLCVPSLDP